MLALKTCCWQQLYIFKFIINRKPPSLLFSFTRPPSVKNSSPSRFALRWYVFTRVVCWLRTGTRVVFLISRCNRWGTRNPLHGDTWFVGFITHRSVQSVFSRTDLKLIRHRQWQCYVIDNNKRYIIDKKNDRGRCITNKPQRHLRTIPWWTNTAGFPLSLLYRF